MKLLLDKQKNQSTIYTRHPTNSCVPKFFSLTQTDGSSWMTSTAKAGAMMILIIKEMKQKTGPSHTIWCSSTRLTYQLKILQEMEDVASTSDSQPSLHYYSNTGWRSVHKLQSRSTSTPRRDRDCHPAGDTTKEGCAPHRLPICTAITRIRKSRRLHLTQFNTTFKQPDIKNNSRTSMDTCTYRHTWKQSGQQAKMLIRNKRLAEFKHRNGGYNP